MLLQFILIINKNSTNIAPRLAFAEKTSESFPENEILVILKNRIFCKDLFSYISYIFNQLSVFCQVRYLQVKGDSALHGSFNIARTSQLQINFSYLKTIIGADHYLQSS